MHSILLLLAAPSECRTNRTKTGAIERRKPAAKNGACTFLRALPRIRLPARLAVPKELGLYYRRLIEQKRWSEYHYLRSSLFIPSGACRRSMRSRRDTPPVQYSMTICPVNSAGKPRISSSTQCGSSMLSPSTRSFSTAAPREFLLNTPSFSSRGPVLG